ncbi:multidrug resistance-associated protein 5 [Tanacetum coccineum]
MVVRRMPYEEFVVYLEEKCGCYFKEIFGRLNLYLDHLDMDLSGTSTTDKGKDKVSEDATTVVIAIDYVEARTSTTDKGKEKVSEDATKSDKSVDYLSPGKEELIELRNRIKANREAKAKAKDNLVSEINEPNDENSIHADNVRGETFEEHDIYMNELLKILNTTNKDGITEDPFISIEKHVERYPMYDETTHWRLRKPKVSEKYISVAQFKECLACYALANGFSLWYERSGEVRVVAKCGQRPPRLSDLKKDFNPGSTVKLGVTVNPDGKTYFDRFYVCFAGLADGWKAWCRKIIALDGCFLKSPNQGEILTAIGRDGNKHIYLVAWAVVNVENKDIWTWFLELLEQDLGLIEAVKDVMPNAEHRQCARHIYENFRKQYHHLEFRKLFRATSKASYPQLFNKVMDKIKSANPNAHKYLMDKNPKSWSRAFFKVDRGCEAIENGFSECFNSVIVNVRHKPLLTMLEAIRVIVLERMNKMREISRKWNPGVCPNIKKRLEWLKEQQRFWHVIPAGGNLFEVRSGSEGFTVDEGKRTCSCRMWQLSRIPCVHDTKSMYSIVLPPKPRKLPGRPRKKRIRSMGEGGSSTRVSKVGAQTNCSNYKKPIHNKASCTKPIVEQTPKAKRVVGRPRNKQSVDDLEDVDVVQRGPMRDEGAGGSRGVARGSRVKGGVSRSRGGTSRSRGGASVMSTWMAFGGNTRNLASFGEETDKITTLHQKSGRIVQTERGDGVAIIKRQRQDLHHDGVRDQATASGRGQLKEDLEPST